MYEKKQFEQEIRKRGNAAPTASISESKMLKKDVVNQRLLNNSR